MNTAAATVPEVTFELSLSRAYIKHWGMLEAVREVIQNALDSDSPFEWEFKGDKMLVHSRGSYLEPRTLLLGETSKDGNEQMIGNFGEGFKLALLVLTRTGHNPAIYNRDIMWYTEFRHSDKYQTDVLTITQQPLHYPRDGITFEICNLNDKDINLVKQWSLAMQGDIGEVYETTYGRILKDRPGELYVGGLYVTNTELKYGYDIKPEHIELERDRQTVNDWNLKNVTRNMWYTIDDSDFVAQLMFDNIPDLEQAHWYIPDGIKEACYRIFQAKHPDRIAVASQEEADRVAENIKRIPKGEPKPRTAFVSSLGFYSGVTNSSSYRSTRTIEIPKDPTPQVILQEWLDNYRDELSVEGYKAFRQILDDSSKWYID